MSMADKLLNIWIVANELDISESWIYSGLVSCGVRLTVFHSPLLAPDRKQRLLDAGAECIELFVRNRLDFCASRILHDELSKRPCDLIYAPLNKPLAAALRAVRGYPAVRVVGYRGTIGHISKFDPAAWITYFHPRMNHIVSVSDAVRRFLVDDLGMPEGKVTRIYKGHDTGWYRGLPLESALPDADSGTVTFCFAGQMRPVKGVDYLLDAMELIPRDMKIRLILLGRIKDPHIGKRISELDDPRVLYIGFRHDATAVIGKCDVFVMPTIEREGLARAVVEAMSQSVPSVVSKVGGLPELVSDGVSGIVVPPKDPRALADAMIRLASDGVLRRTMGSEALNRAETAFNYKDSIDAFARLFRSLAG